MNVAAEKVGRNKLATQSVPFYMRRRAASHNIKRLPRRLRTRAANEVGFMWYVALQINSAMHYLTLLLLSEQ